MNVNVRTGSIAAITESAGASGKLVLPFAAFRGRHRRSGILPMRGEQR
jgi:hypothetical protein